MRQPYLAAVISTVALLVAPSAQARSIWTPAQVRSAVYRTDPCLARIVDQENRAWQPTRYGLGGSYGLPQASPPSKMATAGPDWRTNPWTQLRWMRGYVNGRYHGACAAWAFWQTNHWY